MGEHHLGMFEKPAHKFGVKSPGRRASRVVGRVFWPNILYGHHRMYVKHPDRFIMTRWASTFATGDKELIERTAMPIMDGMYKLHEEMRDKGYLDGRVSHRQP
jgi:hypothetical protein